MPQGRCRPADALGELLNENQRRAVYVRIVDATGRPGPRRPAGHGTLPPPDDASVLTSAGHHPQPHPCPPARAARNATRSASCSSASRCRRLTVAKQQILSQGMFIASAEVLTLLLLGAVGYLMTRNLGRLLRGSQAIAADQPHRLPEKGKDELQLCQHFNPWPGAPQSRIHELGATARQLANSEERYALATRAANDGLWDWDIVGDKTYFARVCRNPRHPAQRRARRQRTPFTPTCTRRPPNRFRLRLIAHLGRESPNTIEHRILHRRRLPLDPHLRDGRPRSTPVAARDGRLDQ